MLSDDAVHKTIGALVILNLVALLIFSIMRELRESQAERLMVIPLKGRGANGGNDKRADDSSGGGTPAAGGEAGDGGNGAGE